MIILGLTGSIGMGKSATAELFREEGVPVYDADAAVHALYAKGGAAVVPVEAAFPGVTVDGAIDRMALRERVLNNAEAMKQLEKIVHPLTADAQKQFRDEARKAGAHFVVLDIPLLYEAGGYAYCDYVAVVTAPAEVQRGCSGDAVEVQRGCRGGAVTVRRDAKDAEGPRLSLLPLEQLYLPWLYVPRLFFLPRL